MLRLRNTLTRAQEEFKPLEGNTVRMYACGPTVYDYGHIGNFRTFVAVDVLRRYLKYVGYQVQHIMNITDVEDKIIRGMLAAGKTLEEYTEFFTQEFLKDSDALNIERPEIMPYATKHLPQMIEIMNRLADSGHTYQSDGSLYFSISSFPGYGKLSGLKLEGNIAGARVDVDEYEKADARDFVLWKAAKEEGEPSWPSPFGEGRPGWHLECSAMSMEYLGESFDIHCGGVDLIFPHHENEIAQTEGATGKPFVRYWMHNAFVNLGAEKMSKSLGNTLLIRDIVRRHDPEALRLYLLGTHYRHPIDFADERITEAARALGRLRSLESEAERISAKAASAPGCDGGILDDVAAHRARFEAAMEDDFNTPQALAALFDLARRLYSERDRVAQGTAAANGFVTGVRQLVSLAQVLGLFERQGRAADTVAPHLRSRIESMLAQRAEARRRRDFSEADRLRAELHAMGVTIEDTSEGTSWKIVS
jgi:cysteinyl-tRNA synthetase